MAGSAVQHTAWTVSVDKVFWNPDHKWKLSLSRPLQTSASHQEQDASGGGEAQIQPSNIPNTCKANF